MDRTTTSSVAGRSFIEAGLKACTTEQPFDVRAARRTFERSSTSGTNDDDRSHAI
jgi:hypothetical protein